MEILIYLDNLLDNITYLKLNSNFLSKGEEEDDDDREEGSGSLEV